MTRDAFDDPRLTAMGLLVETYEGLTARTAAALVQYSLSPAEFDALLRLARSPHRRLRMSDLAAQTALSTSGITRIVDRLERKELLRRESCASDRRGSFAVLTNSGAERLAAVLPKMLDTLERWFVGLLHPDQLRSLLDTLGTIRAAVRPEAAAGAND